MPMFRSCFLILLLICCEVGLSSSTVTPPCPSGATCLYVVPPTYNPSSSNASHPLGAADNPFLSLSAAINAANPAPTVTTYLVMYAGLYNGLNNNQLNTAGKNLVFVSFDYFSNSMPLSAAAGGTIIDGGGSSGLGGTYCLSVGQGAILGAPIVSIIGITIQFCAGNYGPGITVSSGCTLNVNGVVFSANIATVSGGSIFGVLANINIDNSQFLFNSAGYNGAAVHFLGCAVVVANSVFEYGYVYKNGGAGYLEGGTFTMTNSIITYNSAVVTAGGFALSGVQASISDCQFLENLGGGGNALELDGSTLFCTDSFFTGSQAGGSIDGQIHIINQAVLLEGVDNYIINCIFFNSQGLRFSGVSIEDTNDGPYPPTTHLMNATFLANYANGADPDTTGGALHGSNSMYKCSGCLFKQNYGAQLGAGAVCENGATCALENSIFEENYSWGGAAVYVAASTNAFSVTPVYSSASIINCTFKNNAVLKSIDISSAYEFVAPAGFALMGGAVFVGSGSHLYFVGGSLVNNSAEYGGAIFIDNIKFTDILLANITLQNNHATAQGGGLYLTNFPSFANVSVNRQISSLTLINNVAVGGGGGIYVAQGVANYNPAVYGAEVVRNHSQVCSFCTWAGNGAAYGVDVASDPLKLNLQASTQRITISPNSINGLTTLVNVSSGQPASINSASTVYVSAVLVDFFDQKVSVESGQLVQVAAQNGIMSNFIMIGAAVSYLNNSSGPSSTNSNVVLQNGQFEFSMSLLSYPDTQASISVSVPQVPGLSTASITLAIAACTDNEFVDAISGTTNLAVCTPIATMPSDSKAAAITIVAITYSVLALFFLIFMIYRNHKVVYQSSIVFCMFILLGLAMINTAALFSALDKTVDRCTARIFLLHGGFALAVGSISVKLFRLRLIFNNPLLVMLKLSDRVMLWRLFVVLLLNITPVIVWATVDPFQSSGINDDACNSSNSLAYEIVLLFFNGFMLFSSAYFAFGLRNTPSQYNETTSLALLNYVVLVLGIVWVLLRWSANLSATSQSLAETFLLTCAAMLTSCILFGPKVYVIMQALERKAARKAAQQHAANGTKRNLCCLLFSGGSQHSSKAAPDHLHSGDSTTGTLAATPVASQNQAALNEIDLEEFEDSTKTASDEWNALLLDKISALKGRLQLRVGALKHNLRQVAIAEKDVKEIFTLLGSACSEYQFLLSRRGADDKNPMDLVNDPLFTDAANAISRAQVFYSTDSGGETTGTGNASGHAAQQNERKALGKSPRLSRRSQIPGGVSPTNGESVHEPATGRRAPMSGRSLIGKQGNGSGSAVVGTTITSGAMPSKVSQTTSHDSAGEHLGPAFGRLTAHSSGRVMDNEWKEHAPISKAEAQGSSDSTSSSSGRTRNATGSAIDQIELEQVTVRR